MWGRNSQCGVSFLLPEHPWDPGRKYLSCVSSSRHDPSFERTLQFHEQRHYWGQDCKSTSCSSKRALEKFPFEKRGVWSHIHIFKICSTFGLTKASTEWIFLVLHRSALLSAQREGLRIKYPHTPFIQEFDHCSFWVYFSWFLFRSWFLCCEQLSLEALRHFQ